MGPQKGPPVAVTAGLSGAGSGIPADQPFPPYNAGEGMWFQKKGRQVVTG
jgi:hypothetical protein